MNDREAQMYEAATMYYLQGETMDAVGHALGVSRSTVSRLLTDARATGMVQISLTQPGGTSRAVARALEQRFGIRCHVATVKPQTPEVARLDKVARVAAALVADTIADGHRLGLAWGRTVAAVADRLPHRHLPGVTVVQLNGGAHAKSTGTPFVGHLLQTAADAFDGQVMSFPAPAFFDHSATRDMLWRERSVQHVLDAQQACDIAVFGVGTFTGALRSHVYEAGYLDEHEMATLVRCGAVGDICTVFLREDGTYADIPLNARASGRTPKEMASIPRRICVAAGAARVAPLLGALRAGAVTDLVIDDETAAALAARAGLAR